MRFDKYEKQGDYHWKLWRQGNNQYARHAKICSKWVKERPCLDVGCGDGLITALMGEGAFGIDVSKLAIELAKKHGVSAHVKDVYTLDACDAYAAVFMGDVIEHLERPEDALRSVHRSLISDGMLYVTTPPKQASLSAYHYIEYIPEELKCLVEPCGFVLEEPIIVRNDLVEMYGKFRKVPLPSVEQT